MSPISLMLLSSLLFAQHVNAQIDTLKFIDGTYYVLQGDKIIYPDFGNGTFTIVEKEAEFPGGQPVLNNWLAQNIRVDSTLNSDVTLKAIFTISSKGLPMAIVAQGDTINGKGREVIRLIESMPRWKPGMQHGKAVKMRLALPITFNKIEKQKK